MRWATLLAVLAIPVVLAAPAVGPGARVPGLAPEGLLFLRGDLHAHTCYSDGEGVPADAFRLVKAAGKLDFFAVTEHAELLNVPFCPDEACLFAPSQCYASPLPWSTEWDAVLAQADAATDASFVGLRGFEWSSPLDGHMNVLGSAAYTDALRSPAPPMLPFYAWLALPAPLGGSDGVASFNHPGREPLLFDNFTHVPLAEPEVQLLEVYNRDHLYEAQYVQALDRRWHVAATGVSDSHTAVKWVNSPARTVVLAPERTRAAILGALDAMRTYATNDRDLEVVFSVGGQLMGSTVQVGPRFLARVQVLDPTPGDGLRRVTVLTNGGLEAASLDAGGAQSLDWRPTLARQQEGEEWFFVKVEELDGDTAHTAPIWASAS